MSDQNKALLRRYIILSLSALLVTIAYISAKNISTLSKKEAYRAISDGFAIPGMLLTSFGLLVRFAQEGALDGLGYGIRAAALSLIPGGRKRIPKYADYVLEKRSKRLTGLGYFIVVGLVYVAISAVFVWLYSKA